MMKVVSWNARGQITPRLKDGLIALRDADQRIAICGVDLAILPEFGSKINSFQACHKGIYLQRNEHISRKLNLAIFVADGVISEEIHDPVHGVLSGIWKLNDRAIRVVALHAQLNYVKSVLSIQNRLSAWAEEMPLIVGGDFNMNVGLSAGGNSPKKFDAFWRDFTHSLDSAYHVKRNISPSKNDPATLRSSSNNTMIDYIFASRFHFTVLDSDVDCSAQQSDHFAVTAELALR